jgi:tetratricopeptide (TPR) repeat protein
MRRRIVVLISLFAAFSAAGLLGAADLKDVYEDAQRDFRRGQYDLALAEWTRIISPEPTDTGGEMIDPAPVYFNRGLTYKKLLMWKEAADDFSMVVGFNPNDADALYQRGGCYLMLGLSDKGEADILRACELKDDYCTEKMLQRKQEKEKVKTGGNR